MAFYGRLRCSLYVSQREKGTTFTSGRTISANNTKSTRYQHLSSAVGDHTRFSIIKEGKAEILHSKDKSVFYNPVQEFNRDLSIAVISEYIKNVSNNCNGISILEALSASGIRSIRYAKEIPGVMQIIANDSSRNSIESIKRNISHNHVGHVVTANEGDASLFMHIYSKQDPFDVIDIDPYGSPSIFLDAAVKSVANGGLLAITFTDLRALCGINPGICRARYGSVPLYCGMFSHEMAIRIGLQSVNSNANRYGRSIRPLLCIFADFYLRMFIQVFEKPGDAQESVNKLALVYQCESCSSFTLQPIGTSSKINENNFPGIGPLVNSECSHCCSTNGHLLAGPIWTGELCDKNFVTALFQSISINIDSFNSSKRMQCLLSLILDELEGVPLHYSPAELCRKVGCPPISKKLFKHALLNADFLVSDSHTNRFAVKTDAPNEIIWDVIRAWYKDTKVQNDKSEEKEICKLLMQEPKLKVSFSEHQNGSPNSKEKQLPRFLPNPEKFWGPKPKAKHPVNIVEKQTYIDQEIIHD